MSRRSVIIPEEVLIGTPKQAADYVQTIRTLRAASPEMTKQADAEFRKRGLAFIHERDKLAEATTAPEELGTLDKIQADAGGAWDALTSGKPWAVGLAGAAGGGGLAALNELRKKKKDRNWWNTLYGAGLGGGLGYAGAKVMEPGGWGEGFMKALKGVDRTLTPEEIAAEPGVIAGFDPNEHHPPTVEEILAAKDAGTPVELRLLNPPAGDPKKPGTESLQKDYGFATGTNFMWGYGAPRATAAAISGGANATDWLKHRSQSAAGAAESVPGMINDQIRASRLVVDNQVAGAPERFAQSLAQATDVTPEVARLKVQVLQATGTENLEKLLLEQQDQFGTSLTPSEIEAGVHNKTIELQPGQRFDNVHVSRVDPDVQQWADEVRKLRHTEASVLSGDPADAVATDVYGPHREPPDRFRTQVGDAFYTDSEVNDIVAAHRRANPRAAQTRGVTLSTESVAAIDPIEATPADVVTQRYNRLGSKSTDSVALRQSSQELLESRAIHATANRHLDTLGNPVRHIRGPDELARVKAAAMSELSAEDLQKLHAGPAATSREVKNVTVQFKDVDREFFTYRGDVTITQADVAAVHAGRGFEPVQRAVAGVDAVTTKVVMTMEDVRAFLHESGAKIQMVDRRGQPISVSASDAALQRKSTSMFDLFPKSKISGVDLHITDLIGPNAVYEVASKKLRKQLANMEAGQRKLYYLELVDQHKQLKLAGKAGLAHSLAKVLRTAAVPFGLLGALTDVTQVLRMQGIDPKIRQD